MALDHISYSQLNMVLKCGEQYRRRYVKGDRIPPDAKQTRGKCGHRAVEDNLKQKIQAEVDLPVDQVVQTFVDQFDSEKYKVVLSDEELSVFDKSLPKALGHFKDTGVAMIRVFQVGDPKRKVEAISPTIFPIAVEEKFDVEFEGTSTKLTGIIDTVDRDHVISDRKFTGKSPGEDDAKFDDQLSIYDLGHRVRFGSVPSRLEKHCIIDLKTGAKTKIVSAPPRDEDHLGRILRRLEAGLHAIETGTFTPAPSGVWWCSPKWCGYWKTCKLHP